MRGVALVLHHPAFLKFSCADCHKWIYDFETGEPQTFQCGSPDNLQPIKRVTKPPCRLGETCPRGTPEEESESKLLGRNYRMLNAYRQDRAFANGCIPAGMQDGLTRNGFRILDELHEGWRQNQLLEKVAAMLGDGKD